MGAFNLTAVSIPGRPLTVAAPNVDRSYLVMSLEGSTSDRNLQILDSVFANIQSDSPTFYGMILTSLPTSDPEVLGALWLSGTTLKISDGPLEG